MRTSFYVFSVLAFMAHLACGPNESKPLSINDDDPVTAKTLGVVAADLPSKWDKVNDLEWIPADRSTVDAYPVDGVPVAEDDPIFYPHEPDVCDDFVYKLCRLDLDCPAGTICSAPKAACQPTQCSCDSETGGIGACSRECERDVGQCIPGTRDAPVKAAPPSTKNQHNYVPELSCAVTGVNPNPVSYCKTAELFMSVSDSASADLPPGCAYYVEVNSGLDGPVLTGAVPNTLTSLVTPLQETLKSLSIGTHELCIKIIRQCDPYYVDVNGELVTNPYEGTEEYCGACAAEPLVVEVPKLIGTFCGMTAAQWTSEFLNGTNCIDESDTNVVSLDGTPQDDLILGNESFNTINGKAGDDCIYGYGGNDDILGGRNNDYIVAGKGFDRVSGGWGRDIIYGGSDDDRLYGGVGKDNIFGEGGLDTLFGGPGADVLDGGKGDDILRGQWGSDVCYGGPGQDEVRGGWGRDTIYGGFGDDRLKGGPRRDRVFGAEGSDFLMGDGGRDKLYGEAGTDRLCGNSGNDTLDGGAAEDRCNGGSGSDTEVNCEYVANENACTESAFDQGLPVVPPLSGTFCGIPASTWTNLLIDGAVTIIDNSAGSNINIVGTSLPDLIIGNSQSNNIQGKGGNDCIYGGAGNDTIDGDSGNDTIFGEAGNDVLRGGLGADTLHGGLGSDDIKGDSGNDTLWGDDGNDTLNGELGDDLLHGGNHDDALKGGFGSDTLLGEAGRDKLKGGVGDDSLNGGSGNDLLLGDSGSDFLTGGPDNDRLCGNSGPDTLNGDSGSDACRGGLGSDSESNCESNPSWSQCTDAAWNNY